MYREKGTLYSENAKAVALINADFKSLKLLSFYLEGHSNGMALLSSKAESEATQFWQNRV